MILMVVVFCSRLMYCALRLCRCLGAARSAGLARAAGHTPAASLQVLRLGRDVWRLTRAHASVAEKTKRHLRRAFGLNAIPW